MARKKDTVKAAKSAIARQVREPNPPPTPSHEDPVRTQGALVDRHVRNHTPERLYGPRPDKEPEDAWGDDPDSEA
ncbi:hypothetical protein RKE29_05965 [Streptomyces sp. B1866]|uniref:hypothetical protein n=1 Tax=Streptomyces sp. B1866 TaxID=3075431 RepID=UPI00288D5B59|nr:hypothetical protein [Streptomyces sp. B1866]MDT3396186.1 hypothetical protein [Streptomyces sp. B1866]